MSVRNEIVKALNERPTVEHLLRAIVEWEAEHPQHLVSEWGGFESWEIQKSKPHDLRFLTEAGVLRIALKTNKVKHYRLVDREEVVACLKEFEQCRTMPNTGTEDKAPQDMFDCIIGYDEVKDLFRMSLDAPEPVHILMCGPPACAKSLFLLEMARCPGSVYVLGHATSKAGLTDFLLTHNPTYLLIDEIEKMSREDMSALLSLMETGIVGEIKYRRVRTDVLGTRVFAACNRVERLPGELRSRFMELHFRAYTADEFTETVIGVLTKREGLDEDLARYISDRVWTDLCNRDVREAVRLARLCKDGDKDCVDKVVRAMSMYSQKVVYR